jgi:penicillin-binding protein 1A
MTGAYAGILNGGSSVTPYGLVSLKLQGEDEPLFGQGGGIGERVISERAAHALTYMMTQVIERAPAPAPGWTGARRRARPAPPTRPAMPGSSALPPIMWWASGWAMTTTPPLTGVTGGGLPAEIWHEVMVRINKGLPATPLQTEIPVSRYTGGAEAAYTRYVAAIGRKPAPMLADYAADIAAGPCPCRHRCRRRLQGFIVFSSQGRADVSGKRRRPAARPRARALARR